MPDLDQLVRDGSIRLEITGGIPTWEASPGSRHQRMIDRIRASLQTADSCCHFANVDLCFRDGSLKCPDISIFNELPPIRDEPLTQTPVAIIEILNPGFEYKDVALNPQFYLAQGVLDVVIVNPRAETVTHYRTSGVANHRAPVTLDLLCGSRCTVPIIS